MHVALCRALDGHPAPPSALECRDSVEASPTVTPIVSRAQLDGWRPQQVPIQPCWGCFTVSGRVPYGNGGTPPRR